MIIRCTNAFHTNPRLTEGKEYKIDARRDVETDAYSGKIVGYYVHNCLFAKERFEVLSR